jgi:hypothetical protein
MPIWRKATNNSINQQGWLGPEHSDVLSVVNFSDGPNRTTCAQREGEETLYNSASRFLALTEVRYTMLDNPDHAKGPSLALTLYT